MPVAPPAVVTTLSDSRHCQMSFKWGSKSPPVENPWPVPGSPPAQYAGAWKRQGEACLESVRIKVSQGRFWQSPAHPLQLVSLRFRGQGLSSGSIFHLEKRPHSQDNTWPCLPDVLRLWREGCELLGLDEYQRCQEMFLFQDVMGLKIIFSVSRDA